MNAYAHLNYLRYLFPSKGKRKKNKIKNSDPHQLMFRSNCRLIIVTLKHVHNTST